MSLPEQRPGVIIDFNEAKARVGDLHAKDIPAGFFAEQEVIRSVIKTAGVGIIAGVVVSGIVLIASTIK